LITAQEARKLAEVVNNTEAVCENIANEIKELASNHGYNEIHVALKVNIQASRRINDRWVNVEKTKFYIPDREFNIPNLVSQFTSLGFDARVLKYKTYSPSYEDDDSEEFNYISIRW
jgi:hypothetical protein